MHIHDQPKKLLSFMWSNSKVQILLTAVFLFGGIVWSVFEQKSLSEQWHDWIHPLITGATFIMALVIWQNEKRQEWENYLPKKLDIVYLLNGKVYIRVNNAPLTSEVDIRSWGQSIGQTILNRTVRIDFTGFKITSAGINRKRRVMHYGLTIFLREKIEGIEAGRIFEFDEEGNLIPTQEKMLKSVEQEQSYAPAIES